MLPMCAIASANSRKGVGTVRGLGKMKALFYIMLAGCLIGAAPTRDNIYEAGKKILPNDVMDNEDAIFDYLQNGVDTYAANSITGAAIADGAVTTTEILDGTIQTGDLAFSLTSGNILPAGAVFFMLTGTCPSWTTDISSTYANYFIRVNATPATIGGADTHTHTAGSLSGTAHTHSFTSGNANESPTGGGGTGASNMGPSHTHSGSTTSGGGGAITGLSDSGNSVPVFISMRLCQVN